MGVGRPARASPRLGPTTTSAGAACPTGRGTRPCRCWPPRPAVTRRIRLGTLVATPNFRHPVTLAREAIALDDVSGGRLDLGLGPGSEGFDASALGQEPWTPAERLARFEEFLQVLHADHRGGADRTHLHADGALRGGRGAQHAGHAAAPPAAHRRRRGAEGAAPRRRSTGATG